LRIREYRASEGTEYFISVEGSNRGLGGGATQRALAGGQKATKKERKTKKKAQLDSSEEAAMREQFAATLASGGTREERKAAAEAARADYLAARASSSERTLVADEDEDNATLYGLLRLRFNDNDNAPESVFPELSGCALIRELHVYGTLVAAGRADSQKGNEDDRPQHIGIGRTLMGTAELIAAAHGQRRISVIAGVGVRNYYRRLGYSLQGKGQYLIKELAPCPASDRGKTPQSFEASFLDAAERLQKSSSLFVRRPYAAAAMVTIGLAALSVATMALAKHWRRR